MNPHFMYNCLNSIQNLVQKNQNEDAHLYLSKFAALIRQVLNTSKKEEVSLGEELETINGYIDLEKLRFDFDYQLIVEEGIEPVSIFIPPMLLQPIVENALLHGLLPKQGNRRLDIAVAKKENRFCISVEDNGIGREASKDNTKSGNGKGLELTRERLTLMAGKYGAQYEMSIEDLTHNEGQPSGTRVIICFEEEK
jgi:LytS/YehU family sensor histidine kinase